MKDNKKMFMFFVVCIISILSGLLYETVAKSSFHNAETNHQEQFRSSIGYCVILKLVTWLLAEVNCKRTVKKEDYVVIDKINSIKCALIMTLSVVSFMEALYLVSYPFIMMAKSVSVLQVVLIGVFCLKIQEHSDNLGKGKIINAFLVTLGIVLFKLFDPQTSFQAQMSRSTQLLGFLLLMINIIADFLYPDFQAQIQRKSNPKPAQLLAELSKWSFIISFILSLIKGDLIYTINFMSRYPIFIAPILALAVVSYLGQSLVYNIIQNMEQNLVPLVNSTRKASTVVLNLIVFGHRTSFGQITGILIVFSTTIRQGLDILNKQQKMAKQQTKLNQIYEIEPQFGPFVIGREQVGKNEDDDKVGLKTIGSFEEQKEQCTSGSSFQSI